MTDVRETAVARALRYPLFDALLNRRARRFAAGNRLAGGPLAYRSTGHPEPLATEEEALLSFAACRVTGYALAELPYGRAEDPESGGGNIMVHFVGRTVGSGDALHTTSVAVINDDGAWATPAAAGFSARGSLIAASTSRDSLGLMTQALGLGGSIHFAAHPSIWPQTLGFRMHRLPLSRISGMGFITATAARWLGRDIDAPTPVGLERAGEVLLRPFCPPYFATMAEAVRAFIDDKYGQGRGTFRDGGSATAGSTAEPCRPEFRSTLIGRSTPRSLTATTSIAGTGGSHGRTGPSGPSRRTRRITSISSSTVASTGRTR